MAIITLDCEVTEFAAAPPKNNTNVVFAIQDNCLIINLMDASDKVLTQTEISKYDARQLAKLINL